MSALNCMETTMKHFSRRAAGLALLLVLSSPLLAAEPVPVAVTIHDDRFEPAEIRVAAGTALVLTVTNATKVAAELESDDLRFEKIIAAGETATVRVRAVKAGTHEFFNEFNEVVRGTIIGE